MCLRLWSNSSEVDKAIARSELLLYNLDETAYLTRRPSRWRAQMPCFLCDARAHVPLKPEVCDDG